jgi:transcriptional regulator with XRE-family HTH domain
MTSPAQPPPPAEAQLIRRAREAAGLSPETAAARMQAGIIGSARWRQIEAGHRSDSPKPVIAKASTLAHMALAVGVTADRLAEAGRTDAAEVLREVALKSGNRNPPSAATPTSSTLVDERWGMIKGLLELAGRDLNPAEYKELVRRVDNHFQQQPEWMPPVEEAPPRDQHPRRHG